MSIFPKLFESQDTKINMKSNFCDTYLWASTYLNKEIFTNFYDTLPVYLTLKF